MKKIISIIFLGVLIYSSNSLTVVVNGVGYDAFQCISYPVSIGSPPVQCGTAQICNNLTSIFLNINLASGYSFTGDVSVQSSFGVFPYTQRLTTFLFYLDSGALTGQYYGRIIQMEWGVIDDYAEAPVKLDCAYFPYYFETMLNVNDQIAFIGGGSQCSTANGPYYCTIDYKPSCTYVSDGVSCEVNPAQTKCNPVCDTAYAFGAKKINSLQGSPNRWGWYDNLSPGTTITRTIYAGAGGNNLAKSYVVGTVTYTYSSNKYASVQVSVAKNCILTEYHIYIGENLPSDVTANGKFPYKGTSVSGTKILVNNQYVNDIYGDHNSYFISHFSVCCIPPLIPGSI